MEKDGVRLKILLLALTVAASGCVHSVTKPEPYTASEARKAVLDLKDIRELQFYRDNLRPNQSYRGSTTDKMDIVENPDQRILGSSFLLSSGDSLFAGITAENVPIMLSSAVFHYNSSGEAIQKKDDLMMSEENLTISKVVSSRETGIGRVVKAKPSTGSKIVAVYSRERNVVLMAMTASFSEFKVEEAEQMMRKMKSQLRRSQTSSSSFSPIL